MRKKLLSAGLSLVLLLTILPTIAYASTDEMTADANALYELGLFNGTGKDAEGNPIFDLDRAPTRYEAVTMLVRLLGKADEAQSQEWDTPFTDVVEWAKPYVGYAYAHGLTSGTSGTTFGGSGYVTPTQYITFVLRALGYQSGTDFQWDKAYELSDKLGFTEKGTYESKGTYSKEQSVLGTTVWKLRDFVRGDMAMISYNALSIKLKGTDTTLLENIKGSTSNVGEHTHSYITKTLPAGGHYEQVQVGTERVVVGTEKYTVVQCKSCRAIFDNDADFDWHTDPNNPNVNDMCIYAASNIFQRSRDIIEVQPIYENKWVEDSSTTIRVCSICGEKEP